MKQIITTLLTTLALMLTACGQGTSAPLKDVVGIKINEANQSIYSTDASIQLSATVTYDDNSTDDVTEYVEWKSSTDKLTVSTSGVVSVGFYNGGDSNISIAYETLTDGPVNIALIPMKDFNITVSDGGTPASGDQPLLATGIFEDNTSRVILRNILWDLNNSATISIEGNDTLITLLSGDTKITASMFIYDNDYNQTEEIIYTAP
ncbi:hypothetical protein [Sulfurimonas sp.]|jgi:hypothetical protein|uniref:hypothetical protein n=1 Tax=Sulfurimonas sp. TaxID=2022749 RepID=UPI0025D314D5|nr:hypothetical protein [Sulfurimonas sp.]MBT5935254.1 hypothetical protein [Sulfurimonas sp.]